MGDGVKREHLQIKHPLNIWAGKSYNQSVCSAISKSLR